MIGFVVMRKNLFLSSDMDEAIAALTLLYDNSRPNERKISRSGKISMRIGLILKQLDELRRLDVERRINGADDHHYSFGEPVEPELLGLVETTLGSTLPADYRCFLTELGDGGAGPYYGILSLEESIIRSAAALPYWEEPGEVGVRESIPTLPAFTRDFPLESDVDFGEIIGKPASWEEHVALLDRDPEYEAKWGELQARYMAEPYDGGWIPICDFGCGDFFTLVLRGKRRGTIWVNSLDGATGFYCLEVGFEQFYMRWLDHALRRLREPDFVPVNAYYSYLEFGDNPRYRPV
jgi:SMI1 / KNR4 family (SUKH-1)